MNKNLEFIIFFLALLLVCKIKPETEVWLNIFVHGIIKTPFTISDISNIVKNNVNETQHRHMVDYLRDRSEIYSYQPMQKRGLVKIDYENTCNGAAAIAKLYDYQLNCLTSSRLNQSKSPNDIHNLYYTFGWTGYLSRFHREKEAKKLFSLLKKEIKILKTKNIIPKIRIIGFSHAGNLILSMAKVVNCNDKLPFVVDELVILGIPIHKETDEFVNHPIFKKIYNFYSKGDLAQKADFFSTQYVFSHRKFGRKKLCLPDKLKQIQIRTTNVKFDKYGQISKQYHIDPTHMEFWNFEWAPRRYRNKFPLKPFPIISLVPFLISSLNTLENLSNDIVLDMIPNLEKIVITDNKLTNRYLKPEYTLPFISKYDLGQMKNICLEFKTCSQMYKFDKRSLVKDAMRYSLCKRYPFTCN